MAARYSSKLLPGGKIAIPVEICNREEFMLRTGVRIRQSIEKNSIILYRTPEQVERESASDTNAIGKGLVITLERDYLKQLAMQEGELLYFSVVGDVIMVDKARCEKCGTVEQIVEYMPCHFRCKDCIANTIHWEAEHRK